MVIQGYANPLFTHSSTRFAPRSTDLHFDDDLLQSHPRPAPRQSASTHPLPPHRQHPLRPARHQHLQTRQDRLPQTPPPLVDFLKLNLFECFSGTIFISSSAVLASFFLSARSVAFLTCQAYLGTPKETGSLKGLS